MQTEQYLVTARKYRPQRFSDLVSQTHVAGTLKNALKLDRLAHAYLFSGPRGVGKTTAARILAQAINCTTSAEQRDNMEPCGTCDSCQTFQSGRSLNIIEIDAASNNSVEDIRALREKVRIPPQGARKKVYIIDEVHMLSNAAFNALLKTLEEPPPHILFIFATTEPHKVLPTILSRCQRFDFHRISVSETVDRLKEVSASEGVEVEEEALMLIAKKGDGALRDALSVFDQSVALCGSSLRYAELAEALGVVDVDLFFDVTHCVSSADSAGILRICDQLVRRGYDFIEFLAGLTEHIRNLLVIAGTGSDELIDASEPVKERYRAAASDFGENDLLHMLMVLDQAESTIKSSAQPRLKLEMALLKLVRMPKAVDFRTLLNRLDQMQKGLPAEAAKERPKSSNAQSSAQPGPRGPAGGRTSSVADTAVEERSSPPANPVSSSQTRPAEGGAHDRPRLETTARAERAGEAQAKWAGSEPGTDVATSRAPATARKLNVFAEPALKTCDNGRPVVPGKIEPSSVTVETLTTPDDSPATPQLREVVDRWPTCVRTAMEHRIHAGALLQHCTPVRFSEHTLDIGVPDDFHQRNLTSISDFVLSILQKNASPDIRRVRFDIRRDMPKSRVETDVEIDPLEHIQKLRQENPMVRAILDQFGGEMVW